MSNGFIWSSADEPHATRRREMLRTHPEIKELYGPCSRTKYVCTLLVGLQLSLARETAGAIRTVRRTEQLA